MLEYLKPGSICSPPALQIKEVWLLLWKSQKPIWSLFPTLSWWQHLTQLDGGSQAEASISLAFHSHQNPYSNSSIFTIYVLLHIHMKEDTLIFYGINRLVFPYRYSAWFLAWIMVSIALSIYQLVNTDSESSGTWVCISSFCQSLRKWWGSWEEWETKNLAQNSRSSGRKAAWN